MENTLNLDTIKKQINLCPNIAGAYLYGSFAKGTQQPTSDVDIAVFGTDIYKKDLYDLLDKLRDITQKDVDLINLNDNLDSLIGFQVIKYGKLLFATSEHEKNKIQTRYLLKYFDDESFRTQLSSNLDRKLGVI